jgi:AcrR family transcriptional regulator
MVDNTSYRRSNLREALLDRAMIVLGDRGVGALSLRELARDLGVSHAAPARHFADRQQLLEAVAVEGFRLVVTEIRDAIASSSDLQSQARHVAHAYLGFAIGKANLIDVMFRHEPGHGGDAIGQSAAMAFDPLLQLFRRAERDGAVPAGQAETAATLFLAALQGIAALVNCGVVPPENVADLIDKAVPRFVGSVSEQPREVQG